MNVILAVDPIFKPLTGIGRYTYELSAGLNKSPRIKNVRFFRHGHWVAHFCNLFQPDAPVSKVRSKLSRLRFAVWAYGRIMPVISRQRLAKFDDYLFHSPNFILPPFPGRSIATFHDLSIYRFPEFHPEARVRYMQREIPKSLKSADHFIAVSNFTAKEMQRYLGISASKISVVYNGVSHSYHPRSVHHLRPLLARYDLQPGRYLLCVATLEPRKNISTLFKAYERVPSIIKKNYPLVLCGCKGWHNDSLLKDIDCQVTAGWLKFPGYVPERDLPALFAGARGFLYPSLYEGFGLPALEAMASGVPVITSEQSAVSEITQGSALLVNPRDPVGMAESIVRLVEDGKWRRLAIGNGLSISAKMSWSRCIRKTLRVYSEVIQQ